MPRVSRNHLRVSYFHCMVQGINKSYIFENAIDAKYYIKAMYELSQTYEINIIAYCVMGNHTHMLVKSKTVKDLSKYMQCLNTRYAVYYNRKYDRVGYVFKGSFKSEGICDNNYLQNCIKYIYNNPVKAGLCARPEEYPYSNYVNVEVGGNGKYKFIDVYEDESKACIAQINEFLRLNNLDLISLKKVKHN